MAEDQQFFRQYLQSTDANGAQTVREIVSPSLLDATAAAAAEQQAGRTFTGFVSPDKMAGVRSPAEPPPPPQPAVAPLASDVAPSSGAVPTRYQPTDAAGRVSPWLNAIAPALATAGPLALAIAQPELGVPLWLASGGLAALGGGGGEGLRQYLAGEELDPAKMAEQGAVSGATDVLMGKVVVPLATPLVKAVGGRIFPTLGAVEELGPVLASRGAASSAAPTVGDAATAAAQELRSASQPAFDAAREAGRGLPVSTAGLNPHVAAATDAVTRAGATPAQVAEFQTVVRPMTTGAPGEFGQLAGRERQLENWVTGMRAQGAEAGHVARVEQLHTALGGQLDAAAANTPAAPARALYTGVQETQLPQRYALSSLQAAPAAELAAPGNVPAFQAVVKQTGAADRPALAAAWVDSARQAAAQAENPVTYMRAAYDALGTDTQRALFGAQQGAFERVLSTAWGGTAREVEHLVASSAGFGGGGLGASHLGLRMLPGAATARAASDAATPFIARGALMQPPVAAFGAGVSRATGIAAPAAGRLVAQSYAERARQAGVPF